MSTLAGSGVLGFANGSGATAKFDGPKGVAVDGLGNVYVADQHNSLIRKIDAGGVVSTFAGSVEGFADGSGATAKFNRPEGVAVDGLGNVYVSDTFNSRIRKIDSGGVVSTLAGSYYYPGGMAVDGLGNVYVADFGNNRIRKIDTGGVVSTLAGTGEPSFADGPATTAKFDRPYGVTVDGLGNVYVADSYNMRIRKIDSSGIVSTVAGSGFGFADGPGTTALFAFPYGLAVDGSGNLYVADNDNHRIRKIVTTIAQPTTTTNLASQVAPWSVGVHGTLSATTTSSATAPVSGTVELREGANVLSSQPVGPNGVTSFSLALPVGSHTLTAAFLGGVNFQPSTSSLVVVESLPAPELDISISRLSTDLPAIAHVRLSTKSAGSFFKFSLPAGQIPLLPNGDFAVRPVVGGEAFWEFDVTDPPASLEFRVEAVSDAQGAASAVLFSKRTVAMNPCPGWSYELVNGVSTSVCGGGLFSYVQDAPVVFLDNILQVPAGAGQLIGKTEFVDIQDPYYGPAFQIRIKGTTKCWAVPGANPEEMVAAVSTNLDPTSGTGLLVVTCNVTNPSQWFYLEYGTKSFEGDWVYELRPYWNEVGFAIANGIFGTGNFNPQCVAITQVQPPSTTPRVVLRKCEPYGQNPRQYWKAGPGKQTRFDGLNDRPEQPYPATGQLAAFSESRVVSLVQSKLEECSGTLTRLKNDPPSKAFVTTAAHCVFGEFGSVPKDLSVSFVLMGRTFCADYPDVRAKGDSALGGGAADQDFAFLKVSAECTGSGVLTGSGVEAWQVASPVIFTPNYPGTPSTASFPGDVRNTFGQVEARRVSVPSFSNRQYLVDGHLSHGSSGGMIGNRAVISGVVTAIDPAGGFPQPDTLKIGQRSFRGARFLLKSTTLMAASVANLRNSIQ